VVTKRLRGGGARHRSATGTTNVFPGSNAGRGQGGGNCGGLPWRTLRITESHWPLPAAIKMRSAGGEVVKGVRQGKKKGVNPLKN